MRPDQIQRLNDLQEKLADVVLDEADPDMWPGAGIAAADMTQQERGDRYWCKKNAAATFALLERTRSVLDYKPALNQTPGEVEADIGRQIAQREKEAAKLLDAALGRARKAAFDGRAIGGKK